MNKVVFEPTRNQSILIGYCNREAFDNDLFSLWFYEEYENYTVDTNALAGIRFDEDQSPEITIVMATWCSDSRREIPRFYKILDSMNYNYSKLTLINVNREKKAESIELEHFNLQLVPTIIIYKNGEELGRIIESPLASLEADLTGILAK
jgi:thiol-disulfide isomerase/thioredoxin